jgi:hypothetical protein
MGNIWIVTKREFASFFATPVAGGFFFFIFFGLVVVYLFDAFRHLYFLYWQSV